MSLANSMLGAGTFVLIEFEVLYLNLLKWQSDNRNALMGEWRSTWQICICVDGRGDPEQTDPGLMGFCCPFLHYHVVTAGKIHCVESLNA